METPSVDPTQAPIGYLMPGNAALDVLKQVTDIYHYAATHDELTGLANKSAWAANIEERIESEQPFGVIYMDMNSFKQLNDVYGHGRGDDMLKDFGTFLTHTFKRESDLIVHEKQFDIEPIEEQLDDNENLLARWAGDEFVITFDLSGNNRRGVDEETHEPKTADQRMAEQVKLLQKAVDEFVQSQPEDIKKLGFDIAFGATHWDPKNPTTARELLDDVDGKMLLHKMQRKEVAQQLLPHRKKAAAWMAKKLLRYAGTSTSR